VIVAEMSLEHLDDDVQVCLHGLDVPTEVVNPGIDFPDLLIRAFLLPGKLVTKALLLVGNATDNAGQSDDGVSYPIGLDRQLFKICSELCLLREQELHRALHLLR